MKKILTLLFAISVITVGCVTTKTENVPTKTDKTSENTPTKNINAPVVADTTEKKPAVKAEDTPSKKENLRPAPDFSLKDYNGKTVSLSDFKGKPLVLNSWAAWCPFCVKELPEFANVADRNPEVSVVAINRKEKLAIAKAFTDELGVTGRMILLIDEKDTFYRAMGGFAMPETLFVDRDGNIVEHYRGKLTEEQFAEKIKQIL